MRTPRDDARDLVAELSWRGGRPYAAMRVVQRGADGVEYATKNGLYLPASELPALELMVRRLYTAAEAVAP